MTPYIISASRREDIPAFKADWLLERIKEGKVDMCNAYVNYEISFEKTKLMVFWTKNPRPLIEHLNKIPFKYYFQFTLNDYPEYELNIPSLDDRIKTFIELSNKIGAKKVIWRFDPIIVNDKISTTDIISRIERIGNQLHSYTEKLVFSFIDPYKKLGNQFNEIDYNIKLKITDEIININKKWNLELATCAEDIELAGIKHNKCIDSELIKRICGKQRWITGTKDNTQREACGCAKSGDIGSFKECEHKCIYCYAK